MNPAARLGLGTVQWGMPYGVANQTGQPGADEVESILRLGRRHGIELLDTAYAYGSAEEVLGAQPVSREYQIVTKTRPVPAGRISAAEVGLVTTAFDASLSRLRCPQVYGLLVHGAEALLAEGGDRMWAALERIRAEGHARRIGVSVYYPRQLEQILDRYPVDLVQLPFNVYDQRFRRQGLLQRMRAMGVEVHARSVFLQGLLLLDPDRLPAALDGIRAHQQAWHGWLRARRLPAVQACLWFGLKQPEIDRVIIGCETSAQLRDVLRCLDVDTDLADLADFGIDDERVLVPAGWTR